MAKTVRTAEQIREEVHMRIHQEKPTGEGRAETSVPLPKAHPVDAEARNWDMEASGQGKEHDAYVRRVIEEARKEFFLSDAADHDEQIGHSIARR
ncbi:hypothetical protein AWB81_07550 [Caballeronia arationis]|uniref:hypothetical protein n=1 Tax=Caballeronia arationis TaxID=1777142 RepID=UPI00074BFC99|nr:hypothetical protein [Caballeronia arationis]SAL06357.1 hypothetical protein AWB81_07550 [Caballeronia arationis]